MNPHTRVLLRIPLLSGLILAYIAHLSLGSLIRKQEQLRWWRTKTSSRYCRWAIRILGITISIPNGVSSPESGLIVANHISYIDFLVLSALKPTVFISSLEVKKSFLIGRLTELSGSLFIDRRSKTGLEHETEEISALLRNNHNVCVFPEGTTTDGRTLLPFKSSILVCAHKADVPVLPHSIRYQESQNEDNASQTPKQLIAYFGDMTFFGHLFSLIRELSQVQASITPLPPIRLTTAQDRKRASLQAHAAIRATFLTDSSPQNPHQI